MSASSRKFRPRRTRSWLLPVKKLAVLPKQAKADLETSIARRLAAAEDQIASAEASAVKEVRDQAISIAVAAADQVIAKQMTAD